MTQTGKKKTFFERFCWDKLRSMFSALTLNVFVFMKLSQTLNIQFKFRFDWLENVIFKSPEDIDQRTVKIHPIFDLMMLWIKVKRTYVKTLIHWLFKFSLRLTCCIFNSVFFFSWGDVHFPVFISGGNLTGATLFLCLVTTKICQCLFFFHSTIYCAASVHLSHSHLHLHKVWNTVFPLTVYNSLPFILPNLGTSAVISF